MVNMSVSYLGDLRCQLKHGPSGAIINTDAPVDNEGKGASFSPTDLCAASLAACTLTILGIVARRHEIDLGRTRADVRKIMSSDAPRRIARIEIDFYIDLPADHPKRNLLENAARACPVHFSLHPNIEQALHFWFKGEAPST